MKFYQDIFKRVIDLVFCVFFGFIFFYFFVIIGALVKIEDGGPIFFKAQRIGKNFKIFKMYKFRSMKENVPCIINSDGSTFNSKNDPRVTNVGKLIRASSIDEIPQIINVVKGEMSFVGPRASLAEAIGSFKIDEIDKMNVKPGITGYVQAYYRNTLSNRDKRLKDAWYANNLSFFLDIKIIVKTFITVLHREGIYTNEKN